MRTVNEGSAYSTVAYFETNDEPVTPGTVHYKHLNESTNTTLADLTSIAPSTSVTIDVPAEDNAIGSSRNAYETHVITVYTDYGTAAQRTAEERYRVKNLGGVGDPVDDVGDDYGD